ncbi:MAG: IS3 family transposase [Patescibacteria group bacterium]
MTNLSQEQRKEFIEPNNQQISITRQAKLLDISRSSIYYEPKINKQDVQLMNLIDQIYTKYPFYGSRRIKKELKIYYQIKICREKTQRLMRIMGLEAIYPKKRTSFSNKEHKIYPYLLKELNINHPNQVWSTDITYVRLEQGWAYLIAIMDWFSRYVIDWRLSPTLEIDFCLDALNSALNKNIPEIFNTDQDVRFTSPQFTEILKDKNIKISMDSKRRYLDNIFNERLWRTVKYENIYIKHYQNIDEARQGLKQYFTFYNNKRFHSSLNDLTPAQSYFQSKNVENRENQLILPNVLKKDIVECPVMPL